VVVAQPSWLWASGHLARWCKRQWQAERDCCAGLLSTCTYTL